MKLRCIIVDNYDSFTWNLADYVSQTFGTNPTVVRNDSFRWNDIRKDHDFDCIIVSPGPGTVVHSGDLNGARDALIQDELPVLGVCLGHQGLAHVYGAQIQHAPEPFHGRRTPIQHDGYDLFDGVPTPFDAIRYHSLVVDRGSISSCLEITAWTSSGLVMGLRHKHLPKWGIQFHPESILTEHGMSIIQNFRDLACRYTRQTSMATGISVPVIEKRINEPQHEKSDSPKPYPNKKILNVHSRTLKTATSAEETFLFHYSNREHCFWLDSQTMHGDTSRFSFMGCPSRRHLPLIHRQGPADEHLRYLDETLKSVELLCDAEPPFTFRGGFVGYLSYEMKTAFGAETQHRGTIPDSIWFYVDRFVAFDHETDAVWLMCLTEPGSDNEASRWFDEMQTVLNEARRAPHALCELDHQQLDVSMKFSKDEYISAIQSCQEKIVDGESYEVCLTNSFSIDISTNPAALYIAMRRGNPAPFGAFIRSADISILSTSPERFIRIENGIVQTKPIKGTIARDQNAHQDASHAMQLKSSEKDRAENLMIVDLMRNDLARVSTPGSIRVPKLMDIETYETVHQLVSTVESELHSDCSLVDLLRAVFPGGSITGAPKIRTMEIIDAIEKEARGVYCGSIGFLGFGRVADLNIAIRTISYSNDKIRFGAGGAITYLSNPEDEFQEVLLKAEAVLKPIWKHVSGNAEPMQYRLFGRTLHIERAPAATASAPDKRVGGAQR